MANGFTNIIPQILERSLPTLREQSIMPRLVNSDVANVAGRRGQSVDVMVPSAATVRNVTPGQTGTNVDTTISKVTVTLNQWKEAPMYLTDKELEEVMEGYVPAQAQENLKALINTVDTYLLSFYQDVYFHAGTAGTTPFASNLSAFKDARVKLNNAGNLGGDGPAPLTDRRVVLDPDAEGNALILGQFLKADERGDQGGIIAGTIGRKLGSDWYMDQNVTSSHAAVGLSHTTSVLTRLSYTAAATVVTLDRATLTGTLAKGDLFTLAGNSRQFVVTAAVTAGSNRIAVGFKPALGATVASGVAATFVGAHVPNLHFHRDFLAYATRPLGRAQSFGPSGGFSSIVDPISGLVVRLEVSRQHKQWTLSWDILYGATAVRPELACRILG